MKKHLQKFITLGSLALLLLLSGCSKDDKGPKKVPIKRSKTPTALFTEEIKSKKIFSTISTLYWLAGLNEEVYAYKYLEGNTYVSYTMPKGVKEALKKMLNHIRGKDKTATWDSGVLKSLYDLRVPRVGSFTTGNKKVLRYPCFLLENYCMYSLSSQQAQKPDVLTNTQSLINLGKLPL